MPSSPIHLLDGGLGTTLEDNHGLHFTSTLTPLWSSHLLVDPSLRPTLASCHLFFRTSGADILLTATYQVSLEGFARTRTAAYPDGIARDKIPGFLRRATQLAREAAGGEGKVALSLGPYGAAMVPSTEYSGRYDAAHDGEEELARWHQERLGLFVESGVFARGEVDFVAFETVPRVDEIRAIRRVVAGEKALEGVPVWISCLYPGEAEVLCLPDGTDAREVVKAMLDPDVAGAVPWGVGINCTKVGKVEVLVREYEEAVEGWLEESGRSVSLVLCPDGTKGEVYDTATQAWVREVEGAEDTVGFEDLDLSDGLLTLSTIIGALGKATLGYRSCDSRAWRVEVFARGRLLQGVASGHQGPQGCN